VKLKQKTPIQNVQIDHFDRQFDVDTQIGPGGGSTSDNFMDDDFNSMPSTNVTPLTYNSSPSIPSVEDKSNIPKANT
jgi:hypothetical protein